MKKQVAITVIIAAFNEEKCLPACLKCLGRQTFQGEWEVVVVNNNSTDKTAMIAKKWGARVVEETRQGIAPAKARGAKTARGKIIVFLDADIKIGPNWLEEITRAFEEKGVVGVGGPYYFESFRPFWGKLMAWGHFFLLKACHSLPGGNMAILKKVFQQVGGFSEGITFGEDLDIALKVGRLGKIKTCRQMVGRESGRRFEKKGVFRYFMSYWPYLGFFLGRKNLLEKMNLEPIR